MKYTREGAIKKIREFLVSNTRTDETTCQAAARGNQNQTDKQYERDAGGEDYERYLD